jgi:hypothetical protein
MLCDFLTRWLTLAHARRVKAATLESVFHAHNCRRAHLMNARIENLIGIFPSNTLYVETEKG